MGSARRDVVLGCRSCGAAGRDSLRGDYRIELATWPGAHRRYIARMENHGEWLDWVGALT